MTEKEKTLDMVIRNFITRAREMAKSKDQLVMVNAGQGHWAAIEAAGWGAATETIDWAVRQYLKNSENWLFGHEDFQLAIAMTLKGASHKVAEEVLAVAVKCYSWIWPVEQLTDYIGREPTEKEIFSLLEAELANTACLSTSHHEKLVGFAKRYLKDEKVRRIRISLAGKIDEFYSHSD